MLAGVRFVPFSLAAPSGVFVPIPAVGVAAVDVPSAVAVVAFPLALVVLALRFPSARVSHIYHIDRDQRQALSNLGTLCMPHKSFEEIAKNLDRSDCY